MTTGGSSGDQPIVAELNFPLQGPQPGSMSTVRAFPNLSFNRPVFVTHAGDGTDRLFVVEQNGAIWVFPNDDSTSSRTLFLDLRGSVSNDFEQGLLGLAFPPDYENTGLFYVNFTAGSPVRSYIAEFRVSASDPNRADRSSERRLLSYAQPARTHNAGMLAFGPDGYLYISSGDGGGSGDPSNYAQNVNSLLGKILRIDPSGRAGSLGYAVPLGNPFVGNLNARDEIWAYGFRNPWRFSFDRQTGELWCADVGENSREEINVVHGHGNYGWRVYEGTRSFNNPSGIPASAFDAPVYEYPHSNGGSITGGYVYRGARFPSLRGAYIYGDFKSGLIWALVRQNGQVTSNTTLTTVGSVSSFGEDENGELLIINYNGTLRRLDGPTGGGGAFPATLSATGLFVDMASMQPTAGVIPYEIRSPLWSDRAIKTRWLYVPPGTTIDFSPTGAWTFPLGTVIVKHFEIDQTIGDSSRRRRLETRVLINETTGWAGYTYKWNYAQTEADLLTGADVDQLTIHDPSIPTVNRIQTWYYPSRTDCLQCHTVARQHVLGVRTRQLNRPSSAAGGQNQIAWLDSLGLFTSSPGPGPFGAYADPDDTNETLDRRARSYLAANCSSCHLPGGPTRVGLDLRFRTPLDQTNTVDEIPILSGLGLTNPRLIVKGDKSRSVLWERMRRFDAHRMPPLGTLDVDLDKVALIGQWIDSLQ